MPADIVIYAVVAVGLILWLRSILGTRHGNERSRPNPFMAPRSPDGGAFFLLGRGLPACANAWPAWRSNAKPWQMRRPCRGNCS